MKNHKKKKKKKNPFASILLHREKQIIKLCVPIYFTTSLLSVKVLLRCRYSHFSNDGFRFSLGQNISNSEPNQVGTDAPSLTVLNFEGWLYYIKLLKLFQRFQNRYNFDKNRKLQSIPKEETFSNYSSSPFFG